MITGTPTMAIVLAIGRGDAVARDRRSAANAVTDPVSNDAGIIVLCAEVLKMPRAICGATMPTNPSGPQNAVTAAVRRQQLKMALSLIFWTGAPAMVANSSPKRMMSSPLVLRTASRRPATRTAAMIPISFQPVLEKLPADQL